MKKFKKASALILSGALIAGTFSAMLTANAAKSETIGSGTALASYENDFNADDLSSALGDDFSIGYDSDSAVGSALTALTVEEADNYSDLLDGQIVRINNDNLENTQDSRRPYWQQLYFYYKNQSFESFEFSVDLTNTHDGFEMLHFAPNTSGTIYASGFAFVAKYNAFEKQYDLFLGNAAEAVTDLDFFYIKQDSTAAHASVTGKEKTVNVKITFNDGTAVAYIDGEKVLEKTGLDKAAYYPAVALGYNLASDWQGSFDNFKITGTGVASSFERVEQRGIYSNNFDARDMTTALGDDFEIRYDHENWLSATPRKLTVSEADDYADLLDGQIVRINNASESSTDGMRPYWQQLYFYYKNQTFENFEFSVDLTSTHDGFEMIHFAPAVDGSIYSSGFTLATKYDAFKTQYDIFLGNASEAVTDLDFFYIKQDSTAAHASVTGKGKTVNIKITFDNGTAVAYIDGEKVLEKTGLEQIEYYPSVTLGYNLASDWQGSFDNFSIREYDNIVSTEADATGSKLVLRSVKDVKEVGFKATPAEGEIKVSTDYVSANARGKLPFKVAQDGVYYADIDLDGEVGATDISSLKITLLSGGDNTAADINGDTLINILDLIKIKKLLTSADTVEPTSDRYTYYFNTPGGAETVTPYYILNDGTEILGEAVVIG